MSILKFHAKNDDSSQISSISSLLTHSQDDELKHDSIIFLDGDSLPTNYNTRFYLENDTLHALRPVCTPYEHDSDENGLKQTVYSCSKFTNFSYHLRIWFQDIFLFINQQK